MSYFDFQTNFAITMEEVIDLDLNVNPQGDVYIDYMFVIMAIIAAIVQMKIHISLTVVSEAQHFLCEMIS